MHEGLQRGRDGQPCQLSAGYHSSDRSLFQAELLSASSCCAEFNCRVFAVAVVVESEWAEAVVVLSGSVEAVVRDRLPASLQGQEAPQDVAAAAGWLSVLQIVSFALQLCFSMHYVCHLSDTS